MKRYLSWSGGKDSSASIVLAYAKGLHLDGVIFSEVMFDHSRNISGENPKQIQWIYETAIPIIKKMGYPVKVVRAQKDYKTLFNTRITAKSKNKERIGKKWGFPLGGMCFINRDLKVAPIKQFNKQLGECEQIIGIAVDEPERLARLKHNSRSLLAESSITEKDTYKICRDYNLLSPIYEYSSRGGCWFCPNCSIKEFAQFKKEFPELWVELEFLSHDKEIVSQGFKYGRTFASVNREIDLINNQISIFEILNI